MLARRLGLSCEDFSVVARRRRNFSRGLPGRKPGCVPVCVRRERRYKVGDRCKVDTFSAAIEARKKMSVEIRTASGRAHRGGRMGARTVLLR